jgi:tetratricopeptide (TPR) repeat protein
VGYLGGSPRRLAALAVVIAMAALGPATAAAAPKTPGKKGAAPAPPAPAQPQANCEKAMQLLSLGRYSDAETAYLAELGKANPQCAVEGLQRLAGSKGACAQGDYLHKLDKDAKAREEYRRVLAADPDLACAEEGEDEAGPGLRATATTVADDIGKITLWLLLAIALLFLLWYLLLFLLGRPRWSRKLLMRIPAARRWLGVQVQLDDWKDGAATPGMGTGFTALVRGAMRRRLPGSTEELDQVTGQGGVTDALGGLAEVSPQVKAVLALIALIERRLPRARFQAGGVLQPALAGQGVGVSIAVQQESQFGAIETLRAGPFGYGTSTEGETPDIATPMSRLAVPTAAWLDYQLASQTEHRMQITRDPLSYAYFRAGLQWARDRDKDWARLLYMAALARDENNVGALTNLAVFDFRERRHAQAFKRLDRALEILEQNP